REHGLIDQALSVLEHVTERVEFGHRVSRGSLRALVDFFQTFLDASHDAKEEEVLFPALERAGFPKRPLELMHAEHEQARRLLRTVADAASELERSQEAAKRFAEAASKYAMLLREHIRKENHMLFRMADRLLTAEGDREVTAAFERHDSQLLGPHSQE